jgi:hypothetical protein
MTCTVAGRSYLGARRHWEFRAANACYVFRAVGVDHLEGHQDGRLPRIRPGSLCFVMMGGLRLFAKTRARGRIGWLINGSRSLWTCHRLLLSPMTTNCNQFVMGVSQSVTAHGRHIQRVCRRCRTTARSRSTAPGSRPPASLLTSEADRRFRAFLFSSSSSARSGRSPICAARKDLATGRATPYAAAHVDIGQRHVAGGQGTGGRRFDR